MRKRLLLKRVRYLKKLPEKFSAAIKTDRFMNYFDNFKKSVEDENSFIG